MLATVDAGGQDEYRAVCAGVVRPAARTAQVSGRFRFSFALVPVARNSILLVIVGLVFHRFLKHSYPHKAKAVMLGRPRAARNLAATGHWLARPRSTGCFCDACCSLCSRALSIAMAACVLLEPAGGISQHLRLNRGGVGHSTQQRPHGFAPAVSHSACSARNQRRQRSGGYISSPAVENLR